MNRTPVSGMSASNDYSAGHILVVDDDQDVLLSAELVLKAEGKKVQCLANPSDMPALLETTWFHVVLLDMNFTRGFTSGHEGFYWLKKIQELSPTSQIIMATAYSDIELAVQAIKQGAADFLVKPWDNEKLISMVNNGVVLSQKSSLVAGHPQHSNKKLSATNESNFDASNEFNISRLEKQAIAQAIRQYDGNLTQVAKALGLGRTTLYRKMEKYGLSD